MAEVGGIYELQIKYMALETGIPEEKISIHLEKFERDKKVFYRDGWVWVKNLRRYNETGSGKIKTRIFNLLDSVPDCELKKMYCDYHKIPYQYPIDTVSTPEKYRINTVSIPTLQYNTINTDTLIKRDININDSKLKENDLKDCEIENPISRSDKISNSKNSKKEKMKPDDPNYWKFLKENEAIGKIFYQSTKLFPVEKQFGLWVKDCAAFQEAGIDPEIIPKAVSYMNEQKLSIKSPGSILTIARQIMNKN
ncbi:MAG: hypothetical protein ABFD00_02265, partial [Chloroherpetonaceae bacterium]